MRYLIVLLPLCLFAQDEDGWIEKLGDYDPRVRMQAERALLDMGLRAKEKLEAARKSSDAEVRFRATRVLRILEDPVQVQIRRQRPRTLKLVTIAGKERPLAEALFKLGLGSAKKSARFVPGGIFEFAASPWSPKGQVEGYIYKTALSANASLAIEWHVEKVGNREPETCAFHSPSAVFVRDPKAKGLPVMVRGLTRWWSDFRIEFKEPVNSDVRRVGPFEIEIAWPTVIVRSDDPIWTDVLNGVVQSSDIEFTPRIVKDIHTGGSGRWGGRFG